MRETPRRFPLGHGEQHNLVSRPGDVSLIDGSALHDACIALAKRTGREKVVLNFRALHARLASIRREAGMRPASKSIVSLAVDPESEPQQRFTGALRAANFEVDAIDYRDTTLSVRPGSSAAGGDIPVTIAPRICFGLGAQLRHQQPADVIIVSHDFQLSLALVDFASRLEGSRIVLAFWQDMIDPRWTYSRTFERTPSIRFVDLGPHSSELVGFEWSAARPMTTDFSSVF